MMVMDLEADGLVDTVTRIWCVVGFDTETQQTYIFTPDNIHKLPEWLSTVPAISMHNYYGYDKKVLKKVLNYEYSGVVFDTLLASRVLWPDIDHACYRGDDGKQKSVKERHSVASWGVRFNIAKPVHEDWSQFSDEMLHRCKEDVRIQTKLYLKVQEHIQKLQTEDKRIDLTPAFTMEARFWDLMEQQSDFGWDFDLPEALALKEELTISVEALKQSIVTTFPKRLVVPYKTVCKAFKANMKLTEAAINWAEKCDINPSLIEGDFNRISWCDINLNSSDQVKDFLLSRGWVPTSFNYKTDKYKKAMYDEKGQKIPTTPKIPNTVEEWNDIADLLNNDAIKLLAQYYKANHKLKQLCGLIDNVRPDHRISARVVTPSTNTQRAAHRVVCNIMKSGDDVGMGTPTRALFIAPPGMTLVGADAQALEARIKAHYVYPYDKEIAALYMSGDIHNLNALNWGVERKLAKTGEYLLTFGGGKGKLAQALKKPAEEAGELFDAYWETNWALQKVKEQLETAFDKRGYILSIDGRPLSIRYKRALVSSLIQSAGAILMKLATCMAHKMLTKKKVVFHYVGNFHDEMQAVCHPENAELVGQTLVDGMKKAGEYLKLNVQMDGEYKIGKSWRETH
jgi:DNA polymerase I